MALIKKLCQVKVLTIYYDIIYARIRIIAVRI